MGIHIYSVDPVLERISRLSGMSGNIFKEGTGKLDLCEYPCGKDIQGSAMSNMWKTFLIEIDNHGEADS